MPRYSMKLAELKENRRADGSRYLIGGWHDLTVHIDEQPDGTWVMSLAERKPAAARNLALHHTAQAERDTRKQQLATNPRRANGLGARARWHSKVARALAEGVVFLGGWD